MKPWTREDYVQDRQRFLHEIETLIAAGCDEKHPLVERNQRRLKTVDRVLTDPAFGLVAVPVPHPTCIDVTGIDQTPRSEWVCGPQCPKEGA